ncbi:endonuclease/exonuclease/phosphatase family protein [Thalassomonas sp. RHCl1]|uniref:endonuclease/exonuclease/phosphatase family protein n=1 Tax=Thalassomonas sp. RHCl1 TaxID=2995320 RepID=UPI00248C725C|nr:endonuclease/exonuclease/phosphatase family protein [Thalassomonas sp. RHCl1]
MTKKLPLKLALSAALLCSSNLAYAACSISGYEFTPTGTKDSRGLDYQTGAAPADANSGSFDVVVYNIDGFPKCIGGNSNTDFKNLLSELDNANYNIVLMQEMFSKTKHGYLRDESRLSIDSYPYRSKNWRGGMTSYGDGLIRLSDFPFNMANRDDDDYTLATHELEEFDSCHGDLTDSNPDCLTEKGFTVAVHEITENFSVHIYNTHMDAGRDDDDVKARRKQFEQLADFINNYSSHATVILGGDFNNKWSDYPHADEQLEIWQTFLATTGMTLGCQDMISGSDKAISNCDGHFSSSTDQLGYINRQHNPYSLTLAEYGELTNFTGLSDHEPLRARFTWVKN